MPCLQLRELKKEVKGTYILVYAAELPRPCGVPGKELAIAMEGCEGLIKMVWDGSETGLNTEALAAVYTDLSKRAGPDRFATTQGYIIS